MAEPERRPLRLRPQVSCALCRRRKVRCNRETPCSNCIRSKNIHGCVYQVHPLPQQLPPQRPRPLAACDTPKDSQAQSLVRPGPVVRSVPGPGAGSFVTLPPFPTPSTHPSAATNQLTTLPVVSSSDPNVLRGRIRELEEQLSKATFSRSSNPKAPSSPTATHESSLAGTFITQAASTSRIVNVFHKSRLFGQSHWLNGVILLLDIFKTFEPVVRNGTANKSMAGVAKCKAFARVIKAQRTPPWPTIPTHYEALWESVSGHPHADQQPQRVDTAFLVQVKLVLAIGATVYDQDFSLRLSAIRWVYEAHTFTSEPEFKSRLNIRTAVYMGLHRDPTPLPRRTIFAAEMHRRLWNTVLELMVSYSMNAGAPPTISLDDYGTEPPGNYHDEQLVETPADDGSDLSPAAAQPESEFTQTSVAIAMRKILPIRLAIAKLLNDLRSTRRQGDMASAYHESLKLDTDLRAAYRTLTRTLQVLSRNLNEGCWPGSSAALHEAAYAFSRKVVVEYCFKIWRTVNSSPTSPSSADAARQDADPRRATNQDNCRLASHGAGFCRNADIQVSMLLLGELRAQLREEAETSLSLVNRSLLRPDLLAMVTEAKDWAMRNINAGETNVKGYLFASMVSAQIEGMKKGQKGEEALAQMLVKAADEVVDKCVPLLEEMLERETRVRMASGGEIDSGQTQRRECGQGEAGEGMVSQQQQQQQ
ncbi:hypothetical protein QBC32DRAFT_400038 [Pseudoneurospora amorphoporcata]|uniref:Zn(2)-C6 fungal-type domain-containing protein n=1 Tax=Pseudoneurospora amorphoporcata TaxID=241081 RepID=A0AAN6SCY2_9PEZI|nr:hypothetical protein QBC32DRAFT_400038 [Pseudoneurospora amorphoporcata]